MTDHWQTIEGCIEAEIYRLSTEAEWWQEGSPRLHRILSELKEHKDALAFVRERKERRQEEYVPLLEGEVVTDNGLLLRIDGHKVGVYFAAVDQPYWTTLHLPKGVRLCRLQEEKEKEKEKEKEVWAGKGGEDAERRDATETTPPQSVEEGGV